MAAKQKITTFLWYDAQAEEAARLYVSLFKNSKILSIARCGEAGPGPKGSVLTVTFQLDGQEFIALNAGPMFKFTEAISLMVNCDTQAEVDRLWDALIKGGGEASQCGWLKDKFGLSWQITPRMLLKALHDPDPETVKRVMQSMMTMGKIDVAALEAARDARESVKPSRSRAPRRAARPAGSRSRKARSRR